MERLLLRKRSNSATSTAPSDQKPREDKSAPYRDQRYKTLLEVKGSYMSYMIESLLDLASASQALCRSLLETMQPVPGHSLFRDDIFKATWWNNSIPFTEPRPQPDYSVGFRREAFTEEQLTKLSPFLGDFIAGDQSLFMTTYYMYFPFLTCEVKCGAAALDIADRQNAHSLTLAVRAIVELFRAVKREDEVHQQILAFSISHDYCSTWMPTHFKKICSAIDELPSRSPVKKA
ncbi:uncharacterized protein C8A04DRAFT_25870 [Dichotomopilus funicola]|uniref:DUF7924 domain-containing protein n=1 Tax=Dichotomopilus funicola TaxID=1934379 RepID=A0AAN6ZNZ8_9PEZI|nr:hypothetical protein C8A04DRAFT_25870 [Dichotomopilus funicola]